MQPCCFFPVAPADSIPAQVIQCVVRRAKSLVHRGTANNERRFARDSLSMDIFMVFYSFYCAKEWHANIQQSPMQKDMHGKRSGAAANGHKKRMTNKKQQQDALAFGTARYAKKQSCIVQSAWDANSIGNLFHWFIWNLLFDWHFDGIFCPHAHLLCIRLEIADSHPAAHCLPVAAICHWTWAFTFSAMNISNHKLVDRWTQSTWSTRNCGRVALVVENKDGKFHFN